MLAWLRVELDYTLLQAEMGAYRRCINKAMWIEVRLNSSTLGSRVLKIPCAHNSWERRTVSLATSQPQPAEEGVSSISSLIPVNMTPYCVKFLISLLQIGNETMQSVSETFTRHFQTPGARFQARCVYAYLLRQKLLEDVRERIAAIYLLRYGYSCELSSFPFLHVFLQV